MVDKIEIEGHKCKLMWPGWDPQVGNETECSICKCSFTLLWVPEVEMADPIRERSEQDIYSTREIP